jgi:hypothetical protein
MFAPTVIAVIGVRDGVGHCDACFQHHPSFSGFTAGVAKAAIAVSLLFLHRPKCAVLARHGVSDGICQFGDAGRKCC